MSGFGLGGSEHHGGVPTSGQGFAAAHGRDREIADELRRTRGLRRPRRGGGRRWRFWRRRDTDPQS
ncbi:MAG TPA: hypothetical protein VF108_11745 [Actinomycetota bacterium]